TRVRDDAADGGAALAARPHGPKENGRECDRKIGLVTHDDAIVAAQLQKASPQTRCHFRRDDAPHAAAPRRTNEWEAGLGEQPVPKGGIADETMEQPRG